MAGLPYADRDLSWLSFNERVLDEAHDPQVPLASRVKFLAIYSANLDEFFRVRVGILRRLAALKAKQRTKHLPVDPQIVLAEIADAVARQQQRFDTLFTNDICPALRRSQVVLYRSEPFSDAHRQEAAQYFRSTILSYLQPVFVGTSRRMNRRDKLPLLNSQALYFALTLRPKAPASSDDSLIAYLNIPRDKLDRFVELSPIEGVTHFAFLDDIIRSNLSIVFPGYEVEQCLSFKLNRAEDTTIQDEYRGNLVKKIRMQLAERKTAPPIRFLYDPTMPPDLVEQLVHVFRLSNHDLMAGGRYHSLSDLMKLPLTKLPGLAVPTLVPLPAVALDPYESLFDAIRQQDRLLHFPYQSYSYVLRFFNEAAIDPLVYDIQVALYRIAADSLIANALISAARNGKRVTVFVEVKARFDEANNLRWAEEMEGAGVRIIYSLPGVKVHAKIALVRRLSAEDKRGKRGKPLHFGYLSTGNFNEATASVYTDFGLFTCHSGMVKELGKVFGYLKNQKVVRHLKHLLVAPFNLQQRYVSLIDREITLAKQGKKARLLLKLNGLEDPVMIDKLYEANQAGVEVKLLIRGICCLVPGVAGISEGIEVIRLVDQFLEHSRIAIFHNGGKPEVYLASADWMNRNLYHRVEVGFPIYALGLKHELATLLDFQLNDSVKARHVDEQGHNQVVDPVYHSPIRAQQATYDWLKAHG
ncbi:polyphosphate kinase 1 [Spirosoma spitsbergense]|uniref:polyphosphate kinase 1 n=1 Tax=Spirosoma spitsbergense TaxID=431554 RepID=UPI0003689992|nr:polyphosphate kinase 1 [Spirosoma spitsbergense]